MTVLRSVPDEGDLAIISACIENEMEVWIKRTSGEWSRGRAVRLVGGGTLVLVRFYDDKRPDELLQKTVLATDFLEWRSM